MAYFLSFSGKPKSPVITVAYLSPRVGEGTKKEAEECSCDEIGLPNPFITRSLQQYE
jgi:hypothetical protein